MESIAILLSLIFTWLRIVGEKGQVFQGLVHIWVGMLIAAWIIFKIFANKHYYSHGRLIKYGNLAGWLALILTIVEITCFIWFKFHNTIHQL